MTVSVTLTKSSNNRAVISSVLNRPLVLMSTSTHGTKCDCGSDDASSSFADFHEMENTVETDDLTMNLASGSVVFTISGVRFKVCMTRICMFPDVVLTFIQIPRALLQQHSKDLSAMVDMQSGSEEQAIVLSDSINAFRQFRKVLFTSVRFF